MSKKIERITGHIIAILIVGALFWAMNQGLQPTPLATPVAPLPAITVHTETPPAVPAPSSGTERPNPDPSFPGGKAKLITQGNTSLSSNEYLTEMEERYQQRGLLSLALSATQPNLKQAVSKPKGVYWRAGDRLAAIGLGANPQEQAPTTKPSKKMYLTIVQPANTGATWVIYECDATQLPQPSLQCTTEGLGLSGTDPPGVPRHAQLQRILGNGTMAVYRATLSADELRKWYDNAFPASGWRLEPELTLQARESTPCVTCFTRGNQICLLWITPDEEDPKTATVILSTSFN